MLPQRVWLKQQFSLITGIDFAHFSCEEMCMVFKETTGMYEHILLFQFQVNGKERVTCELEMDFKKS